MSVDRPFLALPALMLLAAVGASASAQNTPPGLRDLVGARAGQAEGELQRRGYQAVRTETGDDRKWTFWYSQTYGRCVTIATVNGRYDSIVETPVPDCQRNTAAPSGSPTLPGWPSTLRPIGGAYPAAGSPCRRVGETAATINYLGDSSVLVGCPLGRRHWRVRSLLARGGKVVGSEAGVLLISIPRRR